MELCKVNEEIKAIFIAKSDVKNGDVVETVRTHRRYRIVGFIHWSDGSIRNPRGILIKKDGQESGRPVELWQDYTKVENLQEVIR